MRLHNTEARGCINSPMKAAVGFVAVVLAMVVEAQTGREHTRGV